MVEKMLKTPENPQENWPSVCGTENVNQVVKEAFGDWWGVIVLSLLILLEKKDRRGPKFSMQKEDLKSCKVFSTGLDLKSHKFFCLELDLKSPSLTVESNLKPSHVL